jgi:hypothetical protein
MGAAVPAATVPRGLPRPLRTALFGVAALLTLVFVAQTTITLLDLATRHTTTEVQRFADVTAVEIGDASDVRLAGAPPDAPLELRTKITEGLDSPEHAARVGGDGTLRLSSSCGWTFGDNSCGVDYELRVPAGTRVRVDASSGDVHAEGLRADRPVKLRTSSGDVHAEGVVAPALAIETSSGDIHATGVRAGDVEAHASSGDVDLELTGPADRVGVSTGSGDVSLLVPDAVYRLTTDTGSGDVDDGGLRTSPDAPHSIRATTGSGDVSIEGR